MHSSDFLDGEGMTLRDYFAAKALAGDWANSAEGEVSINLSAESCEGLAHLYYRMADAMLAARGEDQ